MTPRLRRALPRWFLQSLGAIVIAGWGATTPVGAQTAARPLEPLFGIGFDAPLDSGADLPADLGSNAPDRRHAIHIRLVISRARLESVPGSIDFSALDARLAAYAQRPGVDVYLDLRGMPGTTDQLDGWIRFARSVSVHCGSRVAGYVIGLGGSAPSTTDASTLAFILKATAVELRATAARPSVTLGGLTVDDEARLDALYRADVAPYLDAVAADSTAAALRLAPIVERAAPRHALLALGVPLGDRPADAARRLAEQHLSILGTRVTGVTYAASADAVTAARPTVDAIRDLADEPLATLDERAADVVLSPPPVAAGTHRLLFGLTSAATYFVISGTTQPTEFGLIESSGVRPTLRDPVTRTTHAPDRFAYDPVARRATMLLPALSSPLIVDWSLPGGPRIDRTEVSTEVLPTLAEIIARHQQAQAVQDAMVRRYIVDATMTQFFRPNAADSGYDVATEDRFFVEGRDVEFEERSFRLNGTAWGPDRPAFPLLQAEKVLSLPLDLRLTTDYRYVLEGVDNVDGRACFVVRFEPVRPNQSLFRGTVWIDRERYLKVKVHTIQTALGAPMLSSEETQRFARVGEFEGRDVLLLVDLIGRQNVLIAGRSLLVERHLAFRDFHLNPSDFESARAAARASDHVMYRDTEKGLRYLVKEGGERVVDPGTTTKAKAMLFGVNIDPAYDFPLPLGGLNYLNFSFLGPESQLAVLYGGVLALINVQRPHLFGRSIDGSADLFAIAVPSSDRVYDAAGELAAQRLLTVPFSTGLNVGWRASEHLRILGSYTFRYDWFGHERTTVDTFVVPTSTATHGAGTGVEWRQHGYGLALNAGTFIRSTWKPWGDQTTPFDPSSRRYDRYSASLSRDFFSGVQKVHLNAGYYGGRRLDRFSQYQFGLFDEHRLHGVPSSGVRFSELAMARASYAFNLLDQYRAEVSFDQAFGRDRLVAHDWQRITGIGVGLVLRGPRKTIVKADIGKSMLPARYRRPGSVVVQVQVLKPL